MIRRVVGICDEGSISPKAFLILPKTFLDFRSDTIQKRGIKKTLAVLAVSGVSL